MTFYKWRDEYYVRSKSSLTGKRVKTDSRFRTTMVNASLLAEASKIASVVYRLIKDEKKNIILYRQMTGREMGGLRQGMDKEQIAEILKKEWLGWLLSVRARGIAGNTYKDEEGGQLFQSWSEVVPASYRDG